MRTKKPKLIDKLEELEYSPIDLPADVDICYGCDMSAGIENMQYHEFYEAWFCSKCYAKFDK
jgi:hypothetical protein